MIPEEHHKVAIIGAGPGGIQLAYLLSQAGIDCVLVERNSGPGSFFEQFPVHRKLLSINKVNTGFTDHVKNLRWDWNSLLVDDPSLRLGKYDDRFFPHADSLLRYLRDVCQHIEGITKFDCEVLSISRQDRGFRMQTNGVALTCDVLVVATGMPKEHVPAIPGIELVEKYGTHDRTPDGFLNKDVLILGKGNSAFETADDILPFAARIHLISPARLRHASETHFPGHLRQINSPFVETFLLKQQNAVLNGSIQSITKEGDRYGVDITWAENGLKAHFLYDRVIACTGFVMDLAPFDSTVTPETLYDGKLPALTAEWESRNVAGMYFCGALMQSNDYKKSASAFIHGMRYNAATLANLLAEKLGVREFPSRIIGLEVEGVLDAIYERIRRSSSLWHLHGSLCDAYVYDHARKAFRQVKDVPAKLLAESPEYSMSTRIEFCFTFENPADPVEREKFSPGGLLHPALRFFAEGEQIDECHMYEDVYAEWEQSEFAFCFRKPLSRFVAAISAAIVSSQGSPAVVGDR